MSRLWDNLYSSLHPSSRDHGTQMQERSEERDSVRETETSKWHRMGRGKWSSGWWVLLLKDKPSRETSALRGTNSEKLRELPLREAPVASEGDRLGGVSKGQRDPTSNPEERVERSEVAPFTVTVTVKTWMLMEGNK